MPFRIIQTRDSRTSCPKCSGVLESVDGYRSKSNLVFKCLRCKAGVAVPSRYVGRCKLYSDSMSSELIEESEIAGYIGPRCQGCKNYDDATMNPKLNPAILKRCPMLDILYRPTTAEFQKFFHNYRDVDAVEDHNDLTKRIREAIKRPNWYNQ